jgi:hypothetical protein
MEGVNMRIVSNFGKLLFPRLPRDVRRRRTANFFIALFAGVAVAGFIALAMIKLGKVLGH